MTKFIHVRALNIFGLPDTHGGATVAYDFDTETRIASYYVATCALHDHYNKKIGRAIAGGRLAKHSEAASTVHVPADQSVAAAVLYDHYITRKARTPSGTVLLAHRVEHPAPEKAEGTVH